MILMPICVLPWLKTAKHHMPYAGTAPYYDIDANMRTTVAEDHKTSYAIHIHWLPKCRDATSALLHLAKKIDG